MYGALRQPRIVPDDTAATEAQPRPRFGLPGGSWVCDYAGIRLEANAAFRRVTRMQPADELAAEVLRRGSPLRIKARGGSMLPFLRDGDVASVMPATTREIGVGDVICYETPPSRLFVHRVIERKQEWLVAKGDALAFADVIEPPQLLGKVVAIERHGKVTRLDTRIGRWRNRAIVAVSALIPLVIALAIPARRAVRAALRG